MLCWIWVVFTRPAATAEDTARLVPSVDFPTAITLSAFGGKKHTAAIIIRERLRNGRSFKVRCNLSYLIVIRGSLCLEDGSWPAT